MSSLVLNEANEIESGSNGRKERQSVDSKAVLAELFKMLEEYAPGWYTKDHHNRVLAVLLES
jgi:hypothetical protein